MLVVHIDVVCYLLIFRKQQSVRELDIVVESCFAFKCTVHTSDFWYRIYYREIHARMLLYLRESFGLFHSKIETIMSKFTLINFGEIFQNTQHLDILWTKH